PLSEDPTDLRSRGVRRQARGLPWAGLGGGSSAAWFVARREPFAPRDRSSEAGASQGNHRHPEQGGSRSRRTRGINSPPSPFYDEADHPPEETRERKEVDGPGPPARAATPPGRASPRSR